jgi:hypothetical protein
VQIKYPMPEQLDEMIETYGKDVIYNHVKSSITVALQSFIRTKLDPERDGGTMPEDQIQAEVDGDGSEERPGWKPGSRQPGKSQAERLKDQISKMDPEARRLLLAQLSGVTGDDTEVAQDDTENGDDAQEQEVVTQQPVRGGARRR